MSAEHNNGGTDLVETLSQFSEAIDGILIPLEKNDLAAAAPWRARIAGFVKDGGALGRETLERHAWNIGVSADTLLAASAGRTPIEPMLWVSGRLGELGFASEAAGVRDVYEFILALRRWRCRRQSAGPITVNFIDNNEKR